MKNVVLAFVIGALLLTLLTLHQSHATAIVFAVAAVGIGVVASSCLQGGTSWLPMVFGALSPLAFRSLLPVSPWLALALLFVLWSAPRVWLARTGRALAVLAVASVALSTIAAWVAMRYMNAGMLQTVAACVFAGAALSILTLLARTDTPIARGLELASRRVEDSAVRKALADAAEVHRNRHAGRVIDAIPGTAWRVLLGLADRRAALQGNEDGPSAALRGELDAELMAKASVLCGGVAALARKEAPSEVVPAAVLGQTP